MKPIGPLMWEHRLIEQMVNLLRAEIDRITNRKTVNVILVEQAVDFFRTYADRTHHGKEEDILFRELDKRPLSSTDRRVMAELVQEHVFGRQTTRALVAANTRYRNGDDAALAEVAQHLQTLAEFYPKHIAKEDKVFFPAARAYFSEEEDQAMLAEFWEFDRQMIHEKYMAVVDELGKAR